MFVSSLAKSYGFAEYYGFLKYPGTDPLDKSEKHNKIDFETSVREWQSY